MEPGELPRELAPVSRWVGLAPVRVGILDCVRVELPELAALKAMSELLE